MTDILVVIGAGYGDEGKGVITDYLAHHHNNSIIVRFNGGSQAGHTVITPDGIRHVFSHFGCGVFSNRPTFLSEFFICNPLIFESEYKELITKHKNPITTFVHKDCIITTPIDMLINQIMEIRRDSNGGRHGSVGVGINETIERNLIADFKLTVADLQKGMAHVNDKLYNIRHNWLPKRLVPNDNPDEAEQHLLNCILQAGLWQDYSNSLEFFLMNTIIVDDYNLNDYETIIFEGAQGLLLDQTYGVFPHVTRSNTGVKNIIDILQHIDNVNTVDIYYISRPYTTRHGHGPLFGEQELPYNIVDETNKPHEFQGQIRYAPLSFKILYDAVLHDYDQITKTNYTSNLKFVFTCLDQIEDIGICFNYATDDTPHDVLYTFPKEEYLLMISGHASLVSYGPTRGHVKINTPLW